MKKKTKSEYWIVDTATYTIIQKIKEFVDFVAGLKYASADDKANAEQIKWLIENIDKPETFKEWGVFLDILDPNIQSGNGTGIYWKKWWICFEFGKLEIDASDEILDEQHLTDSFSTYFGSINFEKDIIGKRIILDTDLNQFIDDAKNYKSYITEALNEIEVEIKIWNKV